MVQQYGQIQPRSFAAACALGTAEGLVFAAMCTFAKPKGTSVFPSQETMARMIQKSRRTVNRAMGNLEAAGIIERVKFCKFGVIEWRILGAPPVSHLDGQNPPDQVSHPRRTCDTHGAPSCATGVPTSCATHGAQTEHRTEHRTNHIPIRRARAPGRPNVKAAQAPQDPDQEPHPAPAGMQPESSAPLDPWTVGPPDPADDAEVGRVLVDHGLFDQKPMPARIAAAVELAKAYRQRWPRSSALDWIRASKWPQLSGVVKAPAAWILKHLDGYGRLGWQPATKAGRWRKWHRALLEGDAAEAERMAQVEHGYAPEREARVHRAESGPRRQSRPRALADLIPPHLAGEGPAAAQA